MKISSIIKSELALSSQQGQMVRDKIYEKLNNGKRLTLNCGDITCMSYHFIFPICDILDKYPEPFIKQHLRIINTSKFQADMIERCFNLKRKQLNK